MENIDKKVNALKKRAGRRFREARKRAGFASADSAAEAMEISATAVYELERGANWLSPEMVIRAQECLKVDPAVFFTDEVVKIEPTPQEALEVIAKTIKGPLPPAIAARVGKIERIAMGGLIGALDEALNSLERQALAKTRNQNQKPGSPIS